MGIRIAALLAVLVLCFAPPLAAGRRHGLRQMINRALLHKVDAGAGEEFRSLLACMSGAPYQRYRGATLP